MLEKVKTLTDRRWTLMAVKSRQHFSNGSEMFSHECKHESMINWSKLCNTVFQGRLCDYGFVTLK